MSKILGRDELLSGESLKRELVPVPELDGEIYMRDFGAAGVVSFQRRIDSMRDRGVAETGRGEDIELMTLAISLSACDERGALLFSEEDVSQLLHNNTVMLGRLSRKALEISGIDLNIVNKLTSEVADNLPNAPATSSPSALPTNSRKRKRK